MLSVISFISYSEAVTDAHKGPKQSFKGTMIFTAEGAAGTLLNFVTEICTFHAY